MTVGTDHKGFCPYGMRAAIAGSRTDRSFGLGGDGSPAGGVGKRAAADHVSNGLLAIGVRR